MTALDIEAAIRATGSRRKRDRDKVAAAVRGALEVKDWLEKLGAFETPQRLAALVGQCGHESGGFAKTVENLRYSTPERIKAVFGRGRAGRRRFPTVESAVPYVRQPTKLANYVYGGRMGNTQTGDGWRFRGRGYLGLTGRNNYRKIGRALDLGLEASPEVAANPHRAWQIAGHYFATRKRGGKTAFEWADEYHHRNVTRIVNGGTHGLEDRTLRTNAALRALMAPPAVTVLKRGDQGPRVAELQAALIALGYVLGRADGDYGPKTHCAVILFQHQSGLEKDGIAGPRTLAALGMT